MNIQNENQFNEADALCPECGHAFKTYVDRILHKGADTKDEKINCPVCGCNECRIGK